MRRKLSGSKSLDQFLEIKPLKKETRRRSQKKKSVAFSGSQKDTINLNNPVGSVIFGGLWGATGTGEQADPDSFQPEDRYH